MNKEDIITQISDILKESGVLRVGGIKEENFKPHQFRVGAKHIKAADEENEGVLTEEICQRIRCEQPYCNLKYEEHTADKELVLQLARDVTETEVKGELAKLAGAIKRCGIKQIAFAESAEDFKYYKDDSGNQGAI